MVASAASASGSTTMNRDRWVGTPCNVPEPNWANVWCRPSGSDHVVRGLRSPVEADDRVRTGRARAEPVDDGALAGVAEPEVDDDDARAVLGHSRVVPACPVAAPAGSADA